MCVIISLLLYRSNLSTACPLGPTFTAPLVLLFRHLPTFRMISSYPIIVYHSPAKGLVSQRLYWVEYCMFDLLLTIKQATPIPAPPMIAAWSLTNFSVTFKQPVGKIFPGNWEHLSKDCKRNRNLKCENTRIISIPMGIHCKYSLSYLSSKTKLQF